MKAALGDPVLRADLWSPQVGGCSKHHLHQSKPPHNENFPFFFFFETLYESLGFLPKAFLGECVCLDRSCARTHISDCRGAVIFVTLTRSS